ncbi:MAG: DUF3810 domain-containing protein [Coprococcus sp.]|nr:DUF3810 domain-containing protein [Coprococcus sp.]
MAEPTPHTSHNYRKAVVSVLLLAASLGLLFTARFSSSFADWYVLHIYRVLVNVAGRFFGLFPFSVSEVGLYLLSLGFSFLFLRLIVRSFRKNAGWKEWISFGTNCFFTASVLFLIYTICCGVNYNHVSFSESAGIETFPYDVEELADVCTYLTSQVNALSPKVVRAEDGTAIMGNDVPHLAVSAMEHLGTIYKEMDGSYPRPKGLAVPYILSVQHLSGIYSPFTIEANYNSAMVEYNLPFTACHELSHLRGFMQEEEANFIAFLACIHSDSIEFQYSGYLLGWLYATNQLYRADYEAYQEIYGTLSDDVKCDLAANSAFWRRYDGRIAEVANQINDNYLKANGQSDGVRSYGRMTDLMVAYCRSLAEDHNPAHGH